ncbi:MAG TPA: serine/threonine-protein kinase [Gemmataceae bacterium]|nr:serine/threonine-protein kinase [Gemmataceae bacterium]
MGFDSKNSWETHAPPVAVASDPAIATSPIAPAVAAPMQPGFAPIPGYALVQFLGEGACGQVWRAVGPGGVRAALKFIRLSERISEAELRALELIKNLDDHPNVMSVRGIWETNGYLIVAMSLGDRTLMDRLVEANKQGLAGIPADELVEYMADAARGIDFLNEHHIIHRDIKPQNILMVAGRGIKIADFGLAKLQEKALATSSGSMTPAYAPPEFFAGQSSNRSDQYSLAVTYCQLRSGQLPFAGPIAEIVAGHLHAAPNLSFLEPGERQVVARALAKDPTERWPDCRSFARALAATIDSNRNDAQTPTAGLAKGQAMTSTLHGASFRTSADTMPRPSRTRTFLGIGLAALAIVASAAFLAWMAPTTTDPLVQMRRLDIERDIANLPPTAQTVVRERPKDYQEVDKLEPVDYGNFNILSDDRFVDMRLWKQVPDADFHDLASAVVSTDWVRFKKIGPATTFDRDEKTSGQEIFFRAHGGLPSKVLGQKNEIFVGADRVKVRRLSIDVSSVPANEEYEVRYSSTRWNSLQSESELWHGIEGYAGAFKVSLLLIFPEGKPFTSQRLMVSKKGRDTPRAYEGQKILLSAENRQWIYWDVPNPEPGLVYRLHWTW